MERREELAAAALDVVASTGMRGLTHRAVDAAAGVAEGTSSYYFRTRAALLAACVGRLSEETVGRVSAGLPDRVDAVDALIDRACALLEHWLAEGRPRLVARYELSLEATRRPELADALVAGGARVRAAVAESLREAGVDEPDRRAVDLVACVDGLAFDQVAGAGRTVRDAAGRRRAVGAVVRAFVS